MKRNLNVDFPKIIIVACALLLASPLELTAANQVRNVFSEAVAVWHFDGLNAPTDRSSLKAMGNAKAGVELTGSEKAASLARGGDGKVAELDSGYFIADFPELAALNGSKTMTLCLRLRDFQGAWEAPLVSVNKPDDPFANILYGGQLDHGNIGFREQARIDSEAKLEFLWRTQLKGIAQGDWGNTPDFPKGVLRVGVPVDLIKPREWHDVIVRFAGPVLEMFVDGVLVDEEWPYGAIEGLTSALLVGAGFENGRIASRFHGQIDHLAIWQRALSDEEITMLSGGKKLIAQREAEILGEESPELQYWRPRGYNTFVGDVMLFYQGGRFHVYYLYDRRHHQSKWGVGAHQFGHVSTKDLIHWEHHPMALSVTGQTECSLGTGSFVFKDGTYYLYYIQHAKRFRLADAPFPGDNIFLATSKDGIHFTKNPKPVALMNYRGGDINPHVITPETGNRYIMTVSGYKVYTSENMLDWMEAAFPQLTSIRWICTDDFKWNGFRYFTGCGDYVFSSQPIEETKEWIQPSSQALHDSVGVPVVSEFAGNRFIYAGFVGARDGWPYAQQLVFRELVQEKDGTLGMKWPAEMIPRSGSELKLAFTPVKGQMTAQAQSVRVGMADGFSCAQMTGLPQNVRITFKAKPQAGVLHFGICTRATEDYEEGCELRFEPAGQRMQYGEPVNGESAHDRKTKVAMDKIPGLDKEFTVDLIVKDDLVDVCVGNRRTLINRYAGTGDRLFLFARNGEVLFEDIQIRPLLSQPAARTVIVPGRLLFENSDFEHGTLTNWTALGDAFDHHQPTKGDNTTARRASPSRHQRDYWVGTYERYDGKSGKPGDARGDSATGTLESKEFAIEEPFLSFRISGGNLPGEEYAALVIDGVEAKKATGSQTETMRQVIWDVSRWKGKPARIRVKDQSKAPWGVINVDDFRWCLKTEE